MLIYIQKYAFSLRMRIDGGRSEGTWKKKPKNYMEWSIDRFFVFNTTLTILRNELRSVNIYERTKAATRCTYWS